MKIKGSGSFTDATGRNRRILGVGELSDDEKLRELKVSGNISSDKIFCDEVNILGKCEGKFISAKNFSASGKMEIDSLKVEQTVDMKGNPELGSVEAKEIIIESRSGSIDEIKCRNLKIFNHVSEADSAFVIKIFGEKISNYDNFSRVRIKNIDAAKIELENCAVDIVRCQEAFIGSNCVIKKLFVAGEYKVAVDSTIGETIRI